MESKFLLHIYPQAAEDMEHIFDHIYNKLCNPTAAIKHLNDFEAALDTICYAPFSCPLVSNEYIKDNTLRKLIVNSYIVFYRPDEDEQTIEVVRVLYGMMNFKDIL